MLAGLNVQENSMRALNIYITTDQKIKRFKMLRIQQSTCNTGHNNETDPILPLRQEFPHL